MHWCNGCYAYYMCPAETQVSVLVMAMAIVLVKLLILAKGAMAKVLLG